MLAVPVEAARYSSEAAEDPDDMSVRPEVSVFAALRRRLDARDLSYKS